MQSSLSIYSFILFSSSCFLLFIFFFFNDTATTEIYTLSLHDALPTSNRIVPGFTTATQSSTSPLPVPMRTSAGDRKSTRLNSSHSQISYAVFCLKKKKKTNQTHTHQHTPTHLQTQTPHT